MILSGSTFDFYFEYIVENINSQCLPDFLSTFSPYINVNLHNSPLFTIFTFPNLLKSLTCSLSLDSNSTNKNLRNEESWRESISFILLLTFLSHHYLNQAILCGK